MRAARHAKRTCAQNVDHLAHNSPFSPVFAEVDCTLGTTPPHVGSSPPPIGGDGVIRTATRRRHAANQRLMLQNPHRHRHERRRAADKTWAQRRVSRKNPPNTGLPAALREIVRPARPLQRHFREKLAQQAKKLRFRPFWACRANFFALAPTPRPSRAKNFAHRTQKHGDIETNNSTARPQQGTAETGITSTPNNCTKNAHFSPAKATAVSLPHRHKQAKAITVSNHRPTSPAAPRYSARDR